MDETARNKTSETTLLSIDDARMVVLVGAFRCAWGHRSLRLRAASSRAEQAIL